jgi:hypothetical protein
MVSGLYSDWRETQNIIPVEHQDNEHLDNAHPDSDKPDSEKPEAQIALGSETK